MAMEASASASASVSAKMKQSRRSLLGGSRRVNWGFNWSPRSLFSRLAGGSFAGTRDFYEVFGWDKLITSQMIWQMYARGGIARRIVHAYPDAVWAGHPKVEGPSRWTRAFEDIAEEFDLWNVFKRLNVLGEMGRYAILLLGVDDGADLEQPIRPGARKIIYVQPYSDRSAIITSWGDDPKDPMFGLPTQYTINPGLALMDEQLMGYNGANLPAATRVVTPSSFKVHHSRVIHLPLGAVENSVYGAPKLWACWNHLTDLQKVIGGSSESYWLTANRGMSVNIDKDMELSEDDEAALSAEIEDYVNGLQRFVRTRGATVEALGTDVADPKGPVDVIVSQISGTTGIPQRVLVGSEAAHQASTQDKGTWAERVEDYRALEGEPHILKPFLKWCMAYGVLAKTDIRGVTVTWPDAYRLSPLERGQRANQMATALANASTAITNTPNIATVEEVRGQILGFPNDGALVPGTEGAEPQKGALATEGPGSSSGDGGTKTPGNGDGSTDGGGSGSTDSNGQGAARAPRSK